MTSCSPVVTQERAPAATMSRPLALVVREHRLLDVKAIAAGFSWIPLPSD